MTFDALLRIVGALPWFDLVTLKTLVPRERDTLPVQLYRWKQAGRVIELRRGLYALADPFRRAPLHGPAVASALCRPSYLSLEWALSWYGVVPEKAGTFTSVTTRERRTIRNELGVFTYRTVTPALFFGHTVARIVDAEVRIATSEKALVDLWYLGAGEWTPERMESMRFDADAVPDRDRLRAVVDQANRPRLRRAFAAWLEYSGVSADDQVVSG